jgi:hypothetical protein
MGVHHKFVPFYVNWPVLLLILAGVWMLDAYYLPLSFLAAGLVSSIVTVGLCAFRDSRIKIFVRCPGCDRVLGPIPGAGD